MPRGLFTFIVCLLLASSLITTGRADIPAHPSGDPASVPEVERRAGTVPEAPLVAAEGEVLLAETKPVCQEWLGKGPVRWAKISYAALPVGLAVGISTDLVFTLTSGQVQLIPVALARWMPFFNETATVLSTATGRKWIYSGIARRVIDGVAIGALAGLSVRAGHDHGIMVGLMNFANGVGLTYWLPSRYFKQWMTAIPGMLPKPLEKLARTPTGQGVIGVSMIVLLEQILEQANHWVENLPRLFADHQVIPTGRRIASINDPMRGVTLDQAFALFFLDSALDSLEDTTQEASLTYLAGGVPVTLTSDEKTLVRPGLEKLLRSKHFRELLSTSELSFVRQRANLLLAPPSP